MWFFLFTSHLCYTILQRWQEVNNIKWLRPFRYDHKAEYDHLALSDQIIQ